jgi:hypothetical protein
MQTKDGSIPSIQGNPVLSDEPNHWCHGASGSISLFLEAFATFKDPSYLQAALLSGERTWLKGLVRKGFGLCHGITGNAYCLMSIYRATGDFKWRERAMKFIMWTCEESVVSISKCYKFSLFKIVGVPDTPYSLM